MLSKFLGEKINNTTGISNALRKLGYEVIDIVPDVKQLQLKWADEKGCKIDSKNWYLDALKYQITSERPEVVFFQHGIPFSSNYLREIRARNSFVKLVIVHTGYLGSVDQMDGVDVVFCATPSLVKRYCKLGLKSQLLYHYFDTDLIGMLPDHNQEFVFTFLGASGYGTGFAHADRYWILRKLLEETCLEEWLWEGTGEKLNKKFKGYIWDTLKGIFKKFPVKVLEGLRITRNIKLDRLLDQVIYENLAQQKKLRLPDQSLLSLFPLKVHPPLSGLDYLRTIKSSRISFHSKGVSLVNNWEVESGDIGAVRLFEVTGLGSCLLCDSGKNMRDLFDEGEEIVVYHDSVDAVKKAKYLIENPKIAEKIALAGKIRTLNNHTASNRAPIIHEWIKRNVK